MVSRWREAGELLEFAESELKRIRQLYEQAAVKRAVTPKLLISIKIFAEQVRSALDYLAHDIRESYGPPPRATDKIYFPVLDDVEAFHRKVPIWFPQLRESACEIYEYLESVQPYHPGQDWLKHFVDLVNTGKHRQLALHDVREEEAQDGAPGGLGPVLVRVSAVEQQQHHDSWVEFIFPGYGNALMLLMLSLESVFEIHHQLGQLLPSMRHGS